jgi:hypothetical protein
MVSNQEAELSTLEMEAKLMDGSIGQLKRQLDQMTRQLKGTVKLYTGRRVMFLVDQLRAKGLTWCTKCSAVIPEDQAGLMLFEGVSHIRGQEYAGDRYEPYFELHRLCPLCQEKAADSHGLPGDGTSKHFVFQVEHRKDEMYYARRFGTWGKLEAAKCVFPEPSADMVESLAEEYGLPPRLDLDSRDRLVVERAKSEEPT